MAGNFSLKDTTIWVTPGALGDNNVIVPAGDPFQLLSFNGITLDHGGVANYLEGAASLPIGITIGTAKPKLEIKLSNAFEGQECAEAMGGLGSSVIITMVFVRDLMVPQNLLFAPATLSNGAGLESSADKGHADKLSFMYTDCKRNMKSVFNQFA